MPEAPANVCMGSAWASPSTADPTRDGVPKLVHEVFSVRDFRADGRHAQTSAIRFRGFVASGVPEGGASLGGQHPSGHLALIVGRLVIICLRSLFAADCRGKLHRRLDLFRQRKGE